MKTSTEKLFTGQKYINGRESVLCYKCKKQIGLRDTQPTDTGLAWYDPYLNKYVHFGCLSIKRRKEIELISK